MLVFTTYDNQQTTNLVLIKQQQQRIYRMSQKDSTNDNSDHSSIEDMIALLKQYEKMCLHQSDFSSAEEAKNKIQFLKTQQLLMRYEKLENEDKENMENITKQGQVEIKEFQEHWDHHLQELIESLQQVEKNLEEQQEQETNDLLLKLSKSEPPKMKFSSEILDLRKHLHNLIKVKDYKQAQNVKNKIEQKEQQQVQKWVNKHETKKQNKIQALKRKQHNELNALRVKAEATFNERIKERDHKFEILLKKNRKRRIETGKVSRERLRTKTAMLSESKSYANLSRHN